MTLGSGEGVQQKITVFQKLVGLKSKCKSNSKKEKRLGVFRARLY